MTILRDFTSINRLKRRNRSFLLSERTQPPLLYFLMFIYFHCPLQTHLQWFGPLFFMFAFVIALISNFNFLFTIAPFFNVSEIAAVPMLIVGLLSCNQKWKIYLLIFAIGDSAFIQSAQYYFLAFFSLFICIQINRTLIFRTISDNIQFFVGMALISVYYYLIIVSQNYGIPINKGMFIVLIIVTASLAFTFIQSRIECLRQANANQIYSERKMAHFLRMIEEDTSDSFFLKTKILLHSKKCLLISCFCHTKQHKGKTKYFMRQLFENSLRRFSNSTDCLLYEYYVEFLLKNEQLINALNFLSNWQSSGYLTYMGRERARAMIEKELRDANSSNPYNLQYKYALQYDQHYQHVAEEINRIIKLKLHFWGEVNKESSQVIRMQDLGYEIITRMHELNIFYNKIIKNYEKSLFLLDITALYALYMLSTTNFKEYAEQIIKNAAKLLEDVYVFQNSASETFAIRATVKQQYSCITHLKDRLKHLQEMNRFQNLSQIQYKSCSKLIIDDVSNGLCKIFSLKRSDLVGRQLNTIIPDGYKQVHNVRLSELLTFDSESLKEIIPSKFMHKERQLPMKGTNRQLIMGFICIKFEVDLTQGLTFVSVVKLAHDRSSHVLINFSGQITESQEGFNKEIVNHSEIQRYLCRLRQIWLKQKVIKEQRFSIMINTANYGITMNSPLLSLFLQKENLKEICPPIHLEIINQETNRNRTAETDKYNKIGRQIKHMEKAIYNYDAESSTSSSKGGSSAAVIISTFSQGNSTPLYRYLQLTFFISIMTCVLSNLGSFFITQLSWDVTSPYNNPINDTMNMQALGMLTMKAIITISDQYTYYQMGRTFNNTRISQYFGFENYHHSVANFASQIEQAFRDSIFNCLRLPSQLLNPYITQRLSTSLAVANPTSFDQLLTGTSSQNLTYLQLLMIYVTDLNLLAHDQVFSTIMYLSYSGSIAQAQNCTFLSPIIDAAVNHTQVVSIAIHSTMMVVITILLIPICIILRKRLNMHENIFDLFVSIDVEQVKCEIKSLNYICNILRNYRESNEIMKTNVLGYEKNILHPKGSQKRASAENEMIIGLEKYDKSHQNQISLSRCTPLESVSSHREKLKEKEIRGTVLGMIKQSYLTTRIQRTTNVRKRSGELDLRGSILDPSKKLLKDHWIIYFITLSFLVILGFSLGLQIKFYSCYLQGKDELFNTYDNQILFEQSLVISKVMLIEGTTFMAQYFGIPDARYIFVPMLQANPVYYYYDNMQIYSQIIQNCSSNSPLPAQFIKKYCQFNYSEVILKGQFGALFKDLIELRYLLDKNANIGNVNVTAVKQNITQKVYYLESLNIRLEELVLQKVQLLFDSIVRLGQNYQDMKQLLLLISIIWGVVCCLCGFGVVLRMKKEYFREVFMITFLNNQMIAKNKRVESFLETIAKNNTK